MLPGAGQSVSGAGRSGALARVVRLAGTLSILFLPIVVLLQFSAVALRGGAGLSATWIDEGVVYAHAAIIALSIGWTLLADRHVRIDALQSRYRKRTTVAVEKMGLALLLLALCVVAVLSWPFVAASWAVLEGSRESGGLPGVFAIKSLVLVMVGLLAMAALYRLLNRV